jgi:glycosyltransferase involved in cell wall biosynthesis
MKILVVNNAAPFVRGGAEELADHLVRHLNATRGVAAELLRVPFRWEPAERLTDEILLNRLLRIYGADRMIGLKFPAYLIPHPNKTLWLLHQFRQAYDLYDSGHSHLSGHPQEQQHQSVVREADRQCFAESRRIFTNSPVTARRLEFYNSMKATVLYPPLNHPELFLGGEYGNYIFAGGRVSPGKRQHLLIEAMRHVRSGIKLVIAGPPDDVETRVAIERLASEYGVGHKVEFRLGFRDVQEIASLANGALACACLPIDEDSLSYVAMEAFAAAKAVITTRDAGGLLEIVRDGETGLVAEPTAAGLAEAIDTLAGSPDRAKDMGTAARQVLADKKLTWPATIERLLS